MTRKHCFLCDTPITGGNDSAEHIIPNAIGGRKKVRGFICRDCNSNKGNSWDAALAAEFNPLCLHLGIRRERGGVPSQSFDTISGQKIRIDADGRMTIDVCKAQETVKDGKTYIDIKARTPAETRKMLGGFKRKYPDLDVDAVMASLDAQPAYLDDPIKMSFGFGGPEMGRSIIKSSLALAAYNDLDVSVCDDALAYLKDEKGIPCFGFYYQSDVILNRPADTVFHCVGISGSSKKGVLLAYVEYFGAQRIVACLSQKYSGPDINAMYAIDPVAGSELNLQFEIPLGLKDMEALYQHKLVPDGAMEDAFRTPMELGLKVDRERATERAIGDAVDYAFKNCGVKEGEILTEKDAERLASLTMERLQPFVLNRMKKRC